MGHEEITLAVTQKLRIFTFLKCPRKVRLNRVFTLPKQRQHEFDSFFRGVKPDRFPSAFVDGSSSVAAINRRGTTFDCSQFGADRFTQTSLEELRNNKQIRFHHIAV